MPAPEEVAVKDKSLTMGLMTALPSPGGRASRGGHRRGEAPSTERVRYEDDVYTWSLQQCELLRQGRYGELDLEHLIDEVADVARREFNALEGNLRIVLLHLLKRDYQPGQRSRSWALSVQEHRDRVCDLLSDSPGLNAKRDEAVRRAYRGGRRGAADEAGLPVEAFPQDCPYPWADIMDREIVHAEPPGA